MSSNDLDGLVMEKREILCQIARLQMRVLRIDEQILRGERKEVEESVSGSMVRSKFRNLAGVTQLEAIREVLRDSSIGMRVSEIRGAITSRGFVDKPNLIRSLSATCARLAKNGILIRELNDGHSVYTLNDFKDD